MKLRKNPSNLSINSQASTSSVSSIASAARKFIRTLKPSDLRHTQSMPVVRQSEPTLQRADIMMISAPLTHTAVDTARGRYMSVKDYPSGSLQLPYPPINIEGHWKPAGEYRDDPTSIFEPRPTLNDADVAKENIFEPRSVSEDDPSSDFTSCIPVPVWSTQSRQRSMSVMDNFHHQSTGHARIPRTARAYPPRRRNHVPLEKDSLNILRPLSPVREEDSSRRHASCFAFPTFADLVAEVQKLESGGN